MKKIRFLYIISFLSISILGCQSLKSVEPINNEFQILLNELTASNLNPTQGVSLSVYAPDFNISWSGVSGVSDVKEKTSLTIDQPFRVASITKTYVAASILILHENGTLTIDDPISKHISTAHLDILKKGGYQPDEITIRHCLNHTSGLFDYAVGSDNYINIAFKNPKKRWTRTEQLEGAMNWGKPVGQPGEKYHYSDTGYILIGEILEKYSNKNLGGTLRTLLKYNQNQFDDTWLESLDDTIASSLPQVRRYFQRRDYTDWDNSIDLYGGGGLVSTTNDLARFFFKLFNGEIFSQPNTLKLMLSKSGLDQTIDSNYRLGLQAVKIFGKEAFMHSGFWNSYAIYVPEYNASIALNFTRDGNHKYVIKRVLTLLSQNK